MRMEEERLARETANASEVRGVEGESAGFKRCEREDGAAFAGEGVGDSGRRLERRMEAERR